MLFLGATFLFFYLFLEEKIKTERVYFYPYSCLGSFINSEKKAQGEPEVDDIYLINDSNSAVYLGGKKEIYCGNFQGPVKEGKISKMTLKLNLLLTDQKKESISYDSFGNFSQQEKSLMKKIIPSRQVEITNDSNDSSNQKQILDFKSSSFKIFEITYAQEVASSFLESGNFDSSVNSNFQENQTVVDSSDLINSKDSSSLNSSEILRDFYLDSDQNVLLKHQSLFNVFYTLDGQNWNYLGSINSENWKNLSFDIPVDDWPLISKIQFKIESAYDSEVNYFLYLESVFLSVDYLLGEELDFKLGEEVEVESFLEDKFDFSKIDLLKVKGVSPETVVALVFNKEENENQLFLIDLKKKSRKVCL